MRLLHRLQQDTSFPSAGDDSFRLDKWTIMLLIHFYFLPVRNNSQSLALPRYYHLLIVLLLSHDI